MNAGLDGMSNLHSKVLLYFLSLYKIPDEVNSHVAVTL